MAELKLDGFRGLADTINGRMLSKNLNPLKRYRCLLDGLPLDCVLTARFVPRTRMANPISMRFCSVAGSNAESP